jgi:hypothetical protein
MAKVRMSQHCAGRCRRWLPVGTQAFVMHKNWWCPECAREHRRTCAAHDQLARV